MEKECPICFQALLDEPSEGLLCGHTFHSACLDETMKCRGHASRMVLPCPACCKRGIDLQGLGPEEGSPFAGSVQGVGQPEGFPAAGQSSPGHGLEDGFPIVGETSLSQASQLWVQGSAAGFPPVGRGDPPVEDGLGLDDGFPPGQMLPGHGGSPSTQPQSSQIVSQEASQWMSPGTPDALTPEGNPVPELLDEEWGLCFRDVQQLQPDPSMADPIVVLKGS
jgi:hypothetical protein